MATKLSEGVKKLLEAPNFANLATLMPDGSPQVTPVWVDFDGTHVLVNTAEGRQKPRNVRHDPRVAVSVFNHENPYSYAEVRGRVVEITAEGAEEHIDALDFLARVIAHIPEPRLHLIHYLGHYSNVARGRRRKARDPQLSTGCQQRPSHNEPDDGLSPAQRQAQRRAWARLIKRVYEVSPLICARCGSEMEILSVILDPKVINKILDHLSSKGIKPGRGPPEQPAESATAPF